MFWDQACLLPIGGAQAILEYLGAGFIDMLKNAPVVCAAYSWKGKQYIYQIQQEDVETLKNVFPIDPIKWDVLKKLPAPGIFVEYPVRKFAGFFAFWECDIKDQSMELRLLFIGSDEVLPFNLPLHANQETLSKSMQEYIDVAVFNTPQGMDVQDVQESGNLVKQWAYEMAEDALVILRYICENQLKPRKGKRFKKIELKKTKD